MLGMMDGKKVSTVIVSQAFGDGKKEKEYTEPAEMGDYSYVCEEIIAALEAKNPRLLKRALKSFFEMSYYEMEKEEDVEEDSLMRMKD